LTNFYLNSDPRRVMVPMLYPRKRNREETIISSPRKLQAVVEIENNKRLLTA
jgi:hypothetical protein